ncbi:hypothetical protein KR044_010290, partial [Drosophila immigrans]
EMYEFVTHQLQSNELCTSSGICEVGNLNFRSEDLVPQVQFEEFYCTECKKIVKHAHESLMHNMTEAMLKRKLQDKCKLTFRFETECRTFVDQYYHEIYRIMKSHLNSERICVLIGVCDKHKALEQHENLLDLSSELKDSIDNLIHEPDDPNLSPNCEFCENIIQALQKLFSQHNDINRALDQVCSVQSDQYLKYKCLNMLDTHKHLIIELVSKNAAHQQICRSINMCLLMEAENLVQLEEILPKSKGGPKCAICKAMITTLKHMVPNGDNNKIKNALSHVCQKLHKGQHICQDIVNKHTDRIVELIVKHASSGTICKLIGMCSRTSQHENGDQFIQDESQEDTQPTKQLEGIQLEDPKQGPFCIICELLVTRFKLLLDTKEKRNHIMHSMLFTCDILPTFLRQSCHDILLSYGKAVLDLISKISPQDFCHFL